MIELANKSNKFLYKYDWFFNNKNFIMFYAKTLSGRSVIWSMERYCNYNQLSTVVLDVNSKFWYRFADTHFIASVSTDIFVVGFDYLEEWEYWMQNFPNTNFIGICFYQNFLYFSNLNLNYNFFDLYIYFFYVFNMIVWIIFGFINNILLKITNLWPYK